MSDVIVLDLDHTLVYATYDPALTDRVIFERKTGLRVLERPYADLFVSHLKEQGHIVVCTSSLAWYARRIMKHFEIIESPLFSRSSCLLQGDHYRKSLSWIGLSPSPNVTIVDDSPQYWAPDDLNASKLIAPARWMGENGDNELLTLTLHLRGQHK